MPDHHFGRHFPLSKETVRLLCEELVRELEAERAMGLSVERKVLCALRFFATGSKRPECVRRVAEAVVNAGVRNKWNYFSKTSKEKAAVKEDFLRRGAIPGVCDADMRIFTVYPIPPGSDHDLFVWRTTWPCRWFQAGRIANPGE
ncbi:hypothetical protein HPB49_011216 [Dermacentor silvarum]|uniref:Uncharacterized protein n=1 Tax=Dermacentor silvarum TaxID=543639 RepID=A0ACB8CKW6_DERSI|nr:hypothetical protein HPB49_011216 [Dermacentor silvarum]